MKPLERIFFQACWLRCARQVWIGDEVKHISHVTTPRDILHVFMLLGFPQKVLVGYLYKWADKGFFEYGVSAGVGWFVEAELTGEYKVLAEQANSFHGVMEIKDEEAEA